MAVNSATCRLKLLSRCSSSSCGSRGPPSATGRGRPLPDLFAHRFLAGLERVHEALRLLLEHLAALVEPLAGLALGFAGPLLGSLGHLAATFAEIVPRLLT